MMALRCNALKCTELLLRLLEYPDNEIPRDDAQQTPAMIAAQLLDYKAAELLLDYRFLQEKEFTRVKEGNETYQTAVKFSNTYLLKLYNQLIKIKYFEEPLFKFAILNYELAKEEGVTYETQRLAGLIYRKAVLYFKQNKKWKDLEWDEVRAKLDSQQVEEMQNNCQTNEKAIVEEECYIQPEPQERVLTKQEELEKQRCKTYGMPWKDKYVKNTCPYEFGYPTKEYRPKTPDVPEKAAPTAFKVVVKP